MKLTFFKMACFFLAVLLFNSCSGNLTEKEQKTIEKYTKQENHDDMLFGEWMNDKTFTHQKKAAQIAISFGEDGKINERMFVEGEPFNDWHLLYYYYTGDGKIYLYHPAEKGVMAMDDEIFLEYGYELSEDGNLLIMGDDSYIRWNDSF